MAVLGGIAPALCAASGRGTDAADFMRIAVGARPAGLGEAFVAVADETSGMFYNPAGPGFLSSAEVQAMHALWLGGISYSYLGYCQPFAAGAVGFGLQYLGAPPTPKVVNDVSAGNFSYYDAAANILYAYRPTDVFSLGLVARAVQSQIDGSSLSAFTGDVGMLYRTRAEGFSFGVAGQNLTGALGEDALPATYRAGVAFQGSLNDNFSDLLFSLEAGQSGSDPLYCAAGVEHWGGKTLGLRAGYKYITDNDTRAALDPLAPWRAGISVRLKTVQLDYSVQPFAVMGETHRISLSWRPGGWAVRHKQVPLKLKVEPTVFSPNNDGARDSVFFVPETDRIRRIKDWTLTIEDSAAAPVMFFSGKGRLPKILTWEGQADTGAVIGEGKYYARFVATGDGRRQAESDRVEIIADVTPPAVSLQVSEQLIATNEDLTAGTTFFVSATDLTGIDQWKLNIANARGKSVKIFTGSSDKPQSVFWNGTDDYYVSIVPNGSYTATLTALDAAGNRGAATVQCSVSTEPRVREIVREIVVTETKKGLLINLSSQVLFDSGKSVLKPASVRAFAKVLEILKAYPENHVLIDGYTDSTGSRKKNLEISSSRAWNVYSYLVKQGISKARLHPRGHGPDNPVATNRTAAGRAKNRRVEITILKKQ